MTAPRERDHPAVPQRVLYRVEEAMELLALSRSAIYEELRSGRLGSVSRGRSRRIPAGSIEKYVALLVQESEVANGQAA